MVTLLTICRTASPLIDILTFDSPYPQKITEIHLIYLISYRLNLQGPHHSVQNIVQLVVLYCVQIFDSVSIPFGCWFIIIFLVFRCLSEDTAYQNQKLVHNRNIPVLSECDFCQCIAYLHYLCFTCTQLNGIYLFTYIRIYTHTQVLKSNSLLITSRGIFYCKYTFI